jgi:hypothetical protein
VYEWLLCLFISSAIAGEYSTVTWKHDFLFNSTCFPLKSPNIPQLFNSKSFKAKVSQNVN